MSKDQGESSEARIGLLEAERTREIAAEIGVPAPLAELNVFRVLLRRPKTGKAVNDLLLSLLFGGELDDRLRELVIMRIGWATGSNYEWTQHWTIALETFGCTREDLLGVCDWPSTAHFGAPERAVLAATDETLAHGEISAETWARCRQALGSEEACIELALAISAWSLISELTRSLRIPLEEGVASWPPDGTPPAGAG